MESVRFGLVAEKKPDMARSAIKTKQLELIASRGFLLMVKYLTACGSCITVIIGLVYDPIIFFLALFKTTLQICAIREGRPPEIVMGHIRIQRGLPGGIGMGCALTRKKGAKENYKVVQSSQKRKSCV